MESENNFVWTAPVAPTSRFDDAIMPNLVNVPNDMEGLHPLVDALPPPAEFVLFPPAEETPPPRRQPHSKKKPDNHIPRPPNAFILFRSSFIKEWKVSTDVETNRPTLSKIISSTWQGLPEEERKVWYAKAKEAQDEYKREFPQYAFSRFQTKNKGGITEKPKGRGVEPKDYISRLIETRTLNYSHTADHPESLYPGQRQNVQMFSEARDVSICNSEINNVGGDLTVNNYNVYLQPDSEPVQLTTWDRWTYTLWDLKSKMFYAAERVKNLLLPRPFSAMLDITLEEKVAEDALKYPPLLNATVLLSKTSLCIPGVMNQLLSSVRYSFF